MQNLYPQLRSTVNAYEQQIVYSPELPEGSQSPPSSDFEEESPILTEGSLSNLRVSTAPARPLSEIEGFRRSAGFSAIENAVTCVSNIVLREDSKYDLESEEGQVACTRYLKSLEKLMAVFNVPYSPRHYRLKFSKAYRVLYQEGSLCYLNEILDSAQERFPYLYVNAEKYVFSEEVLNSGALLFDNFNYVKTAIRRLYETICSEECSVGSVNEEISAILGHFDRLWANFEELYVHELMLIEADARRFITEAIEAETNLTEIEKREKSKGKLIIDTPKFHYFRDLLTTVICKVNSVANIEGKGRDDLSVKILVEAEGLTRRMSTIQCRPIRILAEKIKKSFWDFRHLIRKYAHNIEIVDPQLKNNSELVEVLNGFENSWERGKTFFLKPKRCEQLIYFSNMVDQLAEKYPLFKEQLECSDSELFVSLPGLLILRSLQREDYDICKHFCPSLYNEYEIAQNLYKNTLRAFSLGKLACASENEFIDILEGSLIGLPVNPEYRRQVIDKRFDKIDQTLVKIKTLASFLHRCKPIDWNKFLDVALISS